MQLGGDESIMDRWILSRLSRAIAEANAGLRDFHMGNAADAIYEFFWEDLCDAYVEAVKPIIRPGQADAASRAAQNTLYTALETGLRLLHPFMPYVTEELWQHLPRRPADETLQSISLAHYPTEVPASFVSLSLSLSLLSVCLGG